MISIFSKIFPKFRGKCPLAPLPHAREEDVFFGVQDNWIGIIQSGVGI